MKKALLLIMAAGVLAAAVLWMRADRAVGDEGVDPVVGKTAEVQAIDPTQEPPAAEPALAPVPTRAATADTVPEAKESPDVLPGHTPGEVLSAYFGPEWESLRPEYAKRIKLDLVLEQPLPKWGSVLAELRAAMRISDAVYERWKLRWGVPQPITIAYLVERHDATDLALDARDLDALEAVLVEARAELSVELQKLRALTDAVLEQKFLRGEYEYGPFAALGSAKLPKFAFHADSAAIRGWSVSWAVGRDEDPEIRATLDELDRIKSRTRAVVAKYVAERKKE